VAVTAVVRWIDRFGNVALALDGEVLDGVSTAGLVVRDEDALVRVVATFAELEPGAIGLLRDANDAVAVVVREGSAASRLRVAVGDRVELVAGFGRLA
jgi:S-adenosylmethionine hydrolase